MKSLDVVVVAHFTGAVGKTNSRFGELCSILQARGVTVELVTSSFRHLKKEHKDPSEKKFVDYKVTYIEEPGYSSNISIERIRSHRRMAANLDKYLATRDVPDVIYCAVPSLAVAGTVANYATKNQVRLIQDVQDLWPEAFEMAIKPKSLARSVFLPISRKADEIYRAADTVVTVSETYSERVKMARNDENGVETVYLGTNLPRFDEYPAESLGTSQGVINLAYIGTFGHSYDLPLTFDAVRILRDQKVGVKLHMMGTGPLEEKWREDTKDIHPYINFHGRLEYPEMVSKLRGCDIAVNPIVPGAAQSIVNKVCDYAAAGLPVVNTQDCEEYRILLQRYGAGINCTPDAAEMAAAIAKLAQNSELRKEMGIGSRQLAEENFDRAVTYHRLADLIENVN